MATVIRKRLRSDESPCGALQLKIHINQKILDQHDTKKMQEIQARTVRQLFEAAHKINPGDNPTSLPLYKQITLHGNGHIGFCSDTVPMDLPVEARKTNCCARQTSYVQEKCTNCIFNLCEECGFSCSDCGCFLCQSCVSLFGCGTVEYPICERCSPFN